MKLLIASDIHGAAGYCRDLLAAWDREGADRLLACHEIRFPAALVAEAAVRVLHGAQAHERAVGRQLDAALFPILRQRL